MSDVTRQTLTCGCQVDTARDFLGRVVGMVFAKGDDCPDARHVQGQAIVMPGRENARSE